MAGSTTKWPPLPAVASLSIKNPGSADKTDDEFADDETDTMPTDKTPIDISSNKGSATIIHGDKKYTFSNVACYQTKYSGSRSTMVVFSAKPIPCEKIQSAASTEDDFSFTDLYDFDFPDHLVLQLGKNLMLSFSGPGTGIGRPIENSTNKLKVEAHRVRGTFKMIPEEVLSNPFSFTATVDAAIITPNTRIAGPGDPAKQSAHPAHDDSPVPMPEGTEDVSQKGSKFRKTHSAMLAMPLADVAAFYRRELAAKGWKRTGAQADGTAMQFKNDTMEFSPVLKRRDDKTAIEIVTRDTALARREGVLPEPGKGRLVLANAHNVDVLFTIGETVYPLAAGPWSSASTARTGPKPSHTRTKSPTATARTSHPAASTSSPT